jgi:type I restriction enzyme M protein
LFAPLSKGFYSLAVEKGTISDTINGERDFFAYAEKVKNAFENWIKKVDGKLRSISSTTKPKLLIAEIAEEIIAEYAHVTLVDKYDAYEVLLSYWNETMSDDVYLLVQEGYKAVRDIEVFKKTTTQKNKDGAKGNKEKETGWDGKLVPKALIIEMFFAAEQKVIDDTGTAIATSQAKLDEMIENAEEDSIIGEVLKDNGNLDKAGLKKKLKDEELEAADKATLQRLQDLVTRVDEDTKAVRELRAALDKKARDQYPKLTDEQIIELLLNRKWYRSLGSGVYALYAAVSHRISQRLTELADRYEHTMPQLEAEVAELESKVKSHLKRMGFKW